MYLICRELPEQFAVGYRWSLVAMKTGGGGASHDPYVAFECAAAASEFIATLPPGPNYSPIEASSLGIDTHLRPDASAILFSSVEHLRAYRSAETGHIPRVPILVRDPFERLVRGLKNRYAAWRTRKFVYEG